MPLLAINKLQSSVQSYCSCRMPQILWTQSHKNFYIGDVLAIVNGQFETSQRIAILFAEASAMHRRCQMTSGNIARTGKNSMLALKFFVMHSRHFVWKNNRRSIVPRGNVRGYIPETSVIFCLSRRILKASSIHSVYKQG